MDLQRVVDLRDILRGAIPGIGERFGRVGDGRRLEDRRPDRGRSVSVSS